MAKRLVAIFALTAMLLSLTAIGFAQESTVKGNLGGTVTDPSGAVVAGATVVVTGPIGERTLTTDSDGHFLFQLLIPGNYSVKISKEGFKTAEIRAAEVVTGRTSNVLLKLELGTSATTIEVNATSVEVDTTSTAVGSNLTDNFYASVPVPRNVTGLFYAAPGVSSGGGTGTANPSIAGGTGLENNYVADGVSITDGGFGGIGVYSRMYGSLSTGINLSFVKEVDVKTAGFEAQYGKSTGGIVQIVTKSGSNQFHGVVSGFFAPQQMEATRLHPDDYAQGGSQERFNLQGKILHQSNFDVDGEVGGPLLKDRLFFFGSFNPQWNTDYDQFAQYRNPSDLGTAGSVPGGTQTHLGTVNVPVRVYSYAGKLTFKLNDHNQFEGSVFGDPTYGDSKPNGTGGGQGPQTASTTTYDKLQYGTRNIAARYNGTFSPTWLMNASFSWGHNNLTDTPASTAFGITDYTQRTPCSAPFFNPDCASTSDPLRGQFTRQGLGYFENTTGENYGVNADTTKTFRAIGEHNLTFGYHYDRNHYNGTKARTGGYIPIDPVLAAQVTNNDPVLTPLLVARGTNAAFQLRARGGSSCIGGAFAAEIYVPGLSNPAGPDVCPDGGIGVNLRQTRGEFGSPIFKTTSLGHSAFLQDNWSMGKYVTLNAGIRWEQQHVEGVNAKYTFVDNWSPRVGISVDPWGNRKSKVYANFGRYTENLPLDIAIRSLSAEFDFSDTNWVPPTDGAGHALINPDGTLPLTTANLLATQTPQPNGGFIRSFNSGASLQAGEAFGRGTRSEYLDEFVVGFEHEFGGSGVIFSTRYVDRRIKRIVEDNAPVSPEAAENGLNQFYFISNVNAKQDLFINIPQIDYAQTFDPVTGAPTGPHPAGCDPTGGNASVIDVQAVDSNGNVVTLPNGNNAFCVPNAFDSTGQQIVGVPGSDGIPDGFVDPNRVYKAIEFEVNKAMSKGWQMRANYRIAKLTGNYEGSFRNDNGQNDPNISSLFDFTRGDFNLLGQQFVPGVLNTDVRHLVNGFVSYTFSGNHAKGLTMGSSVHFQTGIPINNLYAHPVYANAGEIPFCADNTTNCPSARGSLGRTKDFGSVDYHMDYPIRITEGTRLRLGADLFNIANTKTQLRVDQFNQRTVGVPNADFLKPTGIGPSAVNGNTNPGYLRPFNARLSVKFEF